LQAEPLPRNPEGEQRYAIHMMLPDRLVQTFQQAVILHEQGRVREAEQLYQTILLGDKRHFPTLYHLGLLRLQQHRFGDAEQFFRSAVKINERSAEAHEFLGSALIGLNRPVEAVRSYKKAIAIRPDFAEAHNNLGYALQVLGRLQDAMTEYEQALAIRPQYPEAHNNLGNVLHLLDRSDDAIGQYETALKIRPDYPEAHFNLGTAFRAVGRLEDAIPQYEQAIALKPNYFQACNSLGNTLRNLDRLEEAIAQYQKAISLEPMFVEARINHGDVLAALGRHEIAIAVYDEALGVRPEDPDVLTRKGEALFRLGRDAEALASYDAALTVDPDHDLAFDAMARCVLRTCNWSRLATLWHEVPSRVEKGRFFGAFNFLGYSSDPALQLSCAKRYIRQEVPVSLPALWTGRIWRNKKIKIAYVSTGFYKHPTAYLTAELIEIHDRSRFEILGVSVGPDDQSAIRARLICAFDQFHDARGRSDREVAASLNEIQVDILIDRNGYILHSRPGIFAARPAPIQINFLGFTGTLGANFYDYILADKTVLPFDQQPFYTEKIAHLPDTYQVNDRKRPIAEHTPTREEVGLPAAGFVFCCFNNCNKITPAFFDIWMRLLRQVEGSVLWLLTDRTTAEANLRREAAARGINPDRIVFARQVPLDEHLARHRLADLFLDTLPYNAHTTASDALWVGLPVVTCCGPSFAGRVATSLLRAIGMPDLVTHDLEDYERLALRIASEPPLLQDLRERLRRNRLSYPLFDADRYRRSLETAYVRMWEYWQRGEGPTSFTVEPE
jgi:protein O-GlcNAc transferase